MRIRGIRLIDFTTHRDTRLEFVEGINLITGPNGSGKSSIIQAIYFALFGRGLYYGKKESLVRHGSRNLLVEMELDGDRLRSIRRTLRGIETEGLNITSSTALKEYLFRFYNLSPGRFLNTFLIKQGETTSFVDKSPRERLKVYESIMGVDSLRTILEAASELYKRYRNLISQMDMDTIVREIEAVEDEIASLQKELEELKSQLERAIGKKEDIRKRLSRLEKSLKKVEDLEKHLLLLKNKKASLEKVKGELERVERYLEEHRKLYERYLALEEKREIALKKLQLEKDISALEEMLKEAEGVEEEARLYEEYLKYAQDEEIIKIESIASEVKKMVNDLNRLLGTSFSKANEILPYARAVYEEISKRYGSAKEELEKLISTRGMLKSAIEERKKAIETLSGSSEGKCPVCGRPLTPEHRREILERYTMELKGLREQLSDVESRILHLEKEISSLERKLQYRTLLDRLEEYSRWIDERREKLEEWKAVRKYAVYRDSYEKYRKLLGIRQEMERKRVEMEALWEVDAHDILRFLESYGDFYEEYTHKWKLREKLRRELEEFDPQRIDESIFEIENQLRTIDRKSLEEQILEMRRDMEQVVAIVSSLRTREDSIEKIIEEKKRRLRDLKDTYERGRQIERKMSFFKDMAERISALIDRMKTFHDRNLRILMWNYFRDFDLESYNSLHIETTSSGMDIYATTHSGNRVYVQSMSGGEKVALSLSIRMAIARILDIKFRTIIMDEPTAGLDRERVNKLGEILQNFVKMNPGSQIILITHEEALAEYANKRFKLTKVGEETFVEEF